MASLVGGCAGLGRPPTMLEQLLEEINFQRTKEMRQLLKDDSGFVMLQGTTYWTDLFVRHFLFQAECAIDGDDLLFFVRKKHVKTSSRYLPKFETEVDVFRKDSKKLPIGDPDIDWEETVYLNLVVHQFDYTLTLAICTRTSPKELQVLRRHSQKVYASPSRRRMDAKGDLEEMTYPHICFMVDNFDEVFCDILVRDGEMVCVELVASDREGAVQGVIFLGSIRYDALKKVYDARSSLSTKMAQRMTFGLFSGATSQRVEFVRMKGPQGKGHAEMAVTKPKGSGAETPTSEPGYCVTDALWDADWDDAEELFLYRHQRRLSDPSSNLNNYVRGGWRTKPDALSTKARSENEGLDSLANGLTEIEAGDVRDASEGEDADDEGPVQCQRPRKPGASIRCHDRSAHQSSPVVARRTTRPRHRNGAAVNGSTEERADDDELEPASPRGRPKRENSTDDDRDEDEPELRRRQRHPQAIEIGSESLLPSASSPTDDNVRRKLGSGAMILVHGEEELPLDCCRNNEPMPHPHHRRRAGRQQQQQQQQHQPNGRARSAAGRRRRVRSRSLVNGDSESTAQRRCADEAEARSDLANENGGRAVVEEAPPAPDTGPRDANANARPARGPERSATLPRSRRRRAHSGCLAGNPLPPHRVTPDGTAIYYWCELPKQPGSQELDDGAYNPLWTMRGFTQTFHFWKETKRAQSVPLNAFLTYITLPWWSIAKDILDHREGPILTF